MSSQFCHIPVIVNLLTISQIFVVQEKYHRSNCNSSTTFAMSIQWTVIAAFLYAEIGTVIVLLLPFISAYRWQKVFKSRLLRALERQSNIYFTVFIFILLLFFLDAIREVRKYTNDMDTTKVDSHLDAELQVHMKLFRAQRNFYISGFALFLWLVLRRMVTLISAQATLVAVNEATLKQAQGARAAADRLMEQNTKKLGAGEAADNEGNLVKETYEKELQELKHKLDSAESDLRKTKLDCDTMKKQSESVSKEYDRLMEEHSKLQTKFERLEGTEHNKKDE